MILFCRYRRTDSGITERWKYGYLHYGSYGRFHGNDDTRCSFGM